MQKESRKRWVQVARADGNVNSVRREGQKPKKKRVTLYKLTAGGNVKKERAGRGSEKGEDIPTMWVGEARIFRNAKEQRVNRAGVT